MTVCKRFLAPAPGRIVHTGNGVFWVEYGLHPGSIGPCDCIPSATSGPFPSFESALAFLQRQRPQTILI